MKRPITTNLAPVQLVGELMKYLKPPSEPQTSTTFTDSRKLKMWQSVNNEMERGENVRIMKTQGFGEAKIRRVFTQRYKEHDNNFYDFNDFLQALLDVLENQQITPAEAKKKLWKKKEDVKDARKKKGM